ncbi:MAG TPA: hypothetical protein VK841_15360 [Polyangiaceae bacterium]|jgi:hypothetical protein|nr:hypothetical protein [Polyangiaceae bacterium]
MSKENSAADFFDSHVQAGGAIHALQEEHFDLRRLSILGKDFQTDEHPLGPCNVARALTFSGKSAALWRELWGRLGGGGFFLVPDVGEVLVLGPLAASLADACERPPPGAGVGVVGAALVATGLSKRSAAVIEGAVRAGKFAIAVHGSAAEVGDALQTLANGALDAEVRQTDRIVKE